MASINQVTLLGRVGQAPTSSTSQGGTPVTKFSLATSRKVGDAEETQWHNIVCFNKAAEFAGKWLGKGDQVVVIGEIKYNKYTDSEGVTQRMTTIVASNVQLAFKKNEPNDPPSDF
jgi:single-strand DNA-binding protein